MTARAGLILLVLCVTALRLGILALSPTDLFFDEAQYWAWSRNLDWGYFSKPPLIAWVIRASTAIGGSDAPFWVRAAAPVLHGATAVILGLWVATVRPRATIWTGAVYLSMPILAMGSWLVTTDTIMAPFLAGALWAWWHHLKTGDPRAAILAGALAGVAALGKYAAVYFWMTVLVAAVFPALRPRAVGILGALVAFAIVLAPNVVWNLGNGLVTLSHTADNASWGSGTVLNWVSLLEFFAAQAAVIGPVFFVVWLLAAWRGPARFERFLLCASLPVLALVCAQALISRAYANWAFAAYPAAAVLVAVRLTAPGSRKWLPAGLAVNLVLVLGVNALILRPGLWPALSDRYTGRTALMRDILTAAEGRAVASQEREILADLTYTAALDETGQAVVAMVRHDPPANWYETVAPRPPGLPVAYVSDGPPPVCDGEPLVAEKTLAPATGAYRDRRLSVYFVPADCAGS